VANNILVHTTLKVDTGWYGVHWLNPICIKITLKHNATSRLIKGAWGASW